MKTKKTYFKPKKIPYYIVLALLTCGASLILGFLSFSGMYALFPILALALAAFGLSVAYEGEIYLQNIKGSFNKLLRRNYLKTHLAKEYLLKMFPEDLDDKNCPQFFRDYATQLKLLRTFGHTNLNKASKLRKMQVELTLRDMEEWFALELFQTRRKKANKKSAYSQELQTWLAAHKQAHWQNRLKKRRIILHVMKGFSIVAAGFMSVGTSYLIVEAFTIIPAFAGISAGILPALIVPMSLIAGIAYGLLTYNAVCDLINNNTLVKWYRKMRDDWKKGFNWRAFLITSAAIILAILAIALTICTAGTWWTIAKKAQPLFAWLTRLPSFIMGIINPIVIGISAIFFNLQNTAESMDMVDQATRMKGNIFAKIKAYFVQGFKYLRKTENWLQLFNPFRFILKLFIAPIRVVLFIGHLISIGVTTDRMPGVPQIAAALIAIISEGFEDAHYFIGHSHHHDGACGGDDEEPACNHEHDEHAHREPMPLTIDASGHVHIRSEYAHLGHEHHEHAHHEHAHHGHAHHGHAHHVHAHHEHAHHGHAHHGHAHHGHAHHGHAHHGHAHHGHAHHDHQAHAHAHQHNRNQALLKERLSPGHSHNHNTDIPTLILKALVAPLYFLATLWDFLSGKMNSGDDRKKLSFKQAWKKHWGVAEKHEVKLKPQAERPSTQWQKEHTGSLIEKYKSKHLKSVVIGRKLAKGKITELNTLRDKVLFSEQEPNLNESIEAAKEKPIFNKHRMFKNIKKKDESRTTKTRAFLDDLPKHVNLMATAGA